MNPLKLLLLLGGVGVTILTATLAVRDRTADNVPIPTLDLSAVTTPRSSLLGGLVSGTTDRYDWTPAETFVGVIMRGSPGATSFHNFTRCAQSGPLLGPQLSQDTSLRFWGYEYVNDSNGNIVETQRFANGFRGRNLFQGRFFISTGEKNDDTPITRYDYLEHSTINPSDQTIAQTGLLANRLYYWMIERDVYYRCALGIEYACGNGTREGNEQCDDANTANGDGCSATCQSENTSSSSSSVSSSVSSSLGSSSSTTGTGSSSSSGHVDPSSSSSSNSSSSFCYGEFSCPTGSTFICGECSTHPTYLRLCDGRCCTCQTNSSSSSTGTGSSTSSSSTGTGSSSVSSSSISASSSSLSSSSSSLSSSSAISSSSTPASSASGSSSVSSSSISASSSSLSSSSSSLSSSSAISSSSTPASSASGSSSVSSSSATSSSSSSIAAAVCGNGQVQVNEACDDGNLANDDGCSSLCAEESNYYCTGEPSQCEFLLPALPNVALHIEMKNIGVARSAFAGDQNVPLLRFDAKAGSAAPSGINLKNLAFAATQGVFTNTINYELWADTNSDDVIDASIATGTFSGAFLRFSHATSLALLTTSETVEFEVRADVASALTVTPAELKIDFAFGQTDAIVAREVNTSVDAKGIRINLSPCPTATCEMFVSTAATPLWSFTYPQSSSSLQAANCGNGSTQSGEECDDGNTNNNDACVIDVAQSYECKAAVCGDGYLWNTGGGTEECDDGNTLDGDGCFSNCVLMIPPDSIP